MVEKKELREKIDFLIWAFRFLSIIVFGIYLYSTFSLIDYKKFLSFSHVIYIFVLAKYALILLLQMLILLLITIATKVLGVGFYLPKNSTLLPLIGFTTLNNNLLSFIKDPLEWASSILPDMIAGILSLIFLVIGLMILGYLNKGKIDFALWIFLLAELALILSLIFGFQSFKTVTIDNLSDFVKTPLFIHSVIAILFLEITTQLSYFSTFLIPVKERIKRNITLINKFEKLTPQEISVGIEEEIRRARLVEKLSPVATLFTSGVVTGPLAERKFNMQFLAKLKAYYDFMKNKDPELQDKLVGIKTIPTITQLLVTIFISLIIRGLLVIGLSFIVLFLPIYLGGTFMGGKILELSYIEVYVIYISTAFLLLYAISELLGRI